MAEFRLVLDGLELTDEQHRLVSRAILTAGLQAIADMQVEPPVLALESKPQIVNKVDILGGWVLGDAAADEARRHLEGVGVIGGQLGSTP